jgi:2,4-didehydro-3-deoxy-L-rhamnonate hydrolase
MKLCRYGKAGYEKPGMIDGEGRLRDLSKVIQNIGPNELSPRSLKMLAGQKPEALPLVNSNPRFGVPNVGIGKFIAIGLNYSDHAKEAGLALPSEPIVFLKATSCINGPNDDVIQPKNSTKLDWEIELGVVIGTQARYVSEADALNHVAGYCIVNDVSARTMEWGLADREATHWDGFFDWLNGKWPDGFCPCGPWLVTADEVPDPQALGIELRVNGEVRQQGSTAEMLFGVAELIAFASRFMTLEPGDLIATGTPAGVGDTTRTYLSPGDVMEGRIDRLGVLRTPVAASGEPAGTAA